MAAGRKARAGGIVRRVLLALLTLLVGPSPLFGQSYTLGEVQVEGTEKYEVADLLAAAGLSRGEPVGVEDLEQAARQLGELGIFNSVRFHYSYQGEQLSVFFQVEENPTLLPVEFGNFIWFSREEIRAHLRDRVPLFEGRLPPGGTLIHKVILALDQLLSRRGIRGNVIQRVELPNLGAPIEKGTHVFDVGGVAIPVSRLDFPGASRLPEELLRAEARRLEGQEYNVPFLRSFAQKQLLPLYRARGFLRARIGDPQVSLLSRDEFTQPVAVSFRVEEGPVYTISQISWEGLQVATEKELEKILTVRPGDPANSIQLAEDLGRAGKEVYGPKGYLNVRFDYQAEIDDRERRAAFHIRVVEGDLYRFQSVSFAGLPGTLLEQMELSKKLEKDWKLKAGQPYNSDYPNQYLKEHASRIFRKMGLKVKERQTQINHERRTVHVVIRFE